MHSDDVYPAVQAGRGLFFQLLVAEDLNHMFQSVKLMTFRTECYPLSVMKGNGLNLGGLLCVCLIPDSLGNICVLEEFLKGHVCGIFQ